MRKIIIPFIIGIVVLLLLVVSCTKKECETGSDCPEQQGREVLCDEGTCVYKEQSCSKNVKITVKGKVQTAKYLTEERNSDTKQCEVVAKDARQERIIDEKQLPFFKLSTVISFPQPLLKTQDSFAFEFQLKDVHKDLELPVALTHIQVTEKEVLIAEMDINARLTAIGEKARIELPITYDLDGEEERALSFKIDYAHEKKTREGTETFRKDYTGNFKRKVILVNPEKIVDG